MNSRLPFPPVSGHSATNESLDQGQKMFKLKSELHRKLINSMDMRLLNMITPSELEVQIRTVASQLAQSQQDLLTREEREQLISSLVDETLGLGPLEPLLKDPTISDVLINGPSSVYVERRGNLEKVNTRFRDLDHLIEIVQRAVSKVGRRIDESCPLVDARLPDGSRLNAVVAPLALEGALVSIRRRSKTPLTPTSLVEYEALSREMLTFLSSCVKHGKNIVISGGTGAGKTTLLNALSAFIPDGERIVTIEDAAEIQLQQPHVARMETRPANLEGKGEVTTRDLLRNALRMRPDRIIIGECRDRETFDMLQAMNTGHDGGMTTVHANDTREALTRLSLLAGMAAPELPLTIIQQQIAAAIDIIVQVSRLPGGKRRVMQISEITGMQGDKISMHDLFRWQQTGVDREGHPVGGFESCGIVPECWEELNRGGCELPQALFHEGPNPNQRIDRLWGGVQS